MAKVEYTNRKGTYQIEFFAQQYLISYKDSSGRINQQHIVPDSAPIQILDALAEEQQRELNQLKEIVQEQAQTIKRLSESVTQQKERRKK